jgi:hypothetical protein
MQPPRLRHLRLPAAFGAGRHLSGVCEMAIILVTYDLMKPGKDYKSVHDYMKTFNWCKGLESVWLLDTTISPSAIRDKLVSLIDENDKVFVVRITREWASQNYYCGDWLNKPERNW